MGYNKRQPEDLTGRKFGRLTVLSRAESTTRRIKWNCRCDCGTEKVVSGENLRSGHTKSCGCILAERNQERFGTKENVRGMSNTPLYKCWSAMKARCSNPNLPGYKDYGGRGIKVCDRWKEGFSNFYEDMGEGYAHGLQLDRIDVNGDYEPSNCRWVTPTVNARNKRHHFMLDGELVMEICERIGQSYNRVISRVTKYGWDLREAVYTPKQRGRYGVHFTS